MDGESVESLIKSRIRDIPDYPSKGVIFRDITPLLADQEAFKIAIDQLEVLVSSQQFDYIACVEARGFIIGSALAYSMSKALIPVRKKGKLPFRKLAKEYKLEYGTETIEMHEDAIRKGGKVMVIDDLIATGGTASACAQLVKDIGAKVVGYGFLIELTGLKGRERLGEMNTFSVVKY